MFSNTGSPRRVSGSLRTVPPAFPLPKTSPCFDFDLTVSRFNISHPSLHPLTLHLSAFLCPLSANSYNIEFLSFAISDYETKKTIFEVGKDIPVSHGMEMDFDYNSSPEEAFRRIKYTFSEDVLRLPLVGTSLVFSIGDEPLPEFRMIEVRRCREVKAPGYVLSNNTFSCHSATTSAPSSSSPSISPSGSAFLGLPTLGTVSMLCLRWKTT